MMDIESEEGIRSVVLRRSEASGLGFSIMGGAGYEFPPVIYGIEKDSPAARSGMLEAGDVILSINERETFKLSTKEVLKCLRLSGDIVHIKFKRDPHVVSRVRQFLSAPNYLEGQDNHHHINSQQQSPHKQSRQKKGSQIPVYQYQPNPTAQSPQHQPLLSPNSRSTSIPPYSQPYSGGGVGGGDSQRISIPNKPNQSPGHISFTDELFINHSFQHSNFVPHHSPSNKASITKQQQFELENSKNQQVSGNKNGRKNFETFVMTGDAILNVSRNDPNDSYKPSPTKTTSKLTPMPHMPIFVERDKDYNRRIQLEKDMERDKEKSESETASPPLPPPPAPEDIKENVAETNSYSSDKNKSDNLPPPPPPVVEESLEKSNPLHKNGISNQNGEVDGDPVLSNKLKNHHTNNGTQENNVESNGFHPERCPEHQSLNNAANEDTSISSSVMSDSGDEVGGDDEDVRRMSGGGGGTSDSKNRIVLKVEARKTDSPGSFDAERERDTEITEVIAEKTTRERERYNEYILLNGSRGTLNEDDLSGRLSAPHQHSYSQAINKEERTPSTVTGGHDNRSTDPESEGDDSISEHDFVGAGCDKSGNLGGGNESGGSFSGDSDSSDVESMRVAPVTKAVDVPSAERLAKRLFQLDGFKATDVWRHLSKNTDFNRVVATEYLKFFDFKDETLDVSLRKFLAVCPLRGETQDRERVLSYFSGRYVERNPSTFGTQDSVHTLACALMLLNTDIYSGIRNGQRMTCNEFIENLSGLNEGGDFPRDVLKQLYLSIRSQPLVSPHDHEDDESTKDILPMDPPVATATVEFKRGYLIRKCTHEIGGKKTPVGKRSWKMFYCRLKELLLVLSPDETNKVPVLPVNQLKLHHAYASVASDYMKRLNVLRLTLSDRSQFLFQTGDTREMHSWIDMINWNAARWSSQALEAPCSSTGKFQRPLLPSCVTRMSQREQIETHKAAAAHWEKELDDLAQSKKKSSSSSAKKEEKEKLLFYQQEIRRYKTYVDVLEKRANAEGNERLGIGNDELVELQVLPNPPVPVLREEDS